MRNRDADWGIPLSGHAGTWSGRYGVETHPWHAKRLAPGKPDGRRGTGQYLPWAGGKP
jgi:hypothetical protein